MTTAESINHTISAFNISAASENKIHDDSIAKRFGFQGGLVPGVEVYAYMTNPIIQCFGGSWLETGSAECKFIKPVCHVKSPTFRLTWCTCLIDGF